MASCLREYRRRLPIPLGRVRAAWVSLVLFLSLPLEPSHAIFQAMKTAAAMRPDEDLLIGLSGRGDKDMHTVAAALGVTL